MADSALVTVPDEGAAEMVRAALDEVSIPARLERGYAGPYSGSVLASPWKVLVPEERLADARAVLERLEHDMAEEVEGQAAAEVDHAAPAAPPMPTERAPRISWALGLALIVPLPVVCFYVRAWRRGAVWMGLTLVPIVLAAAQGIWGFPAMRPALDSPLEYVDHLLLLFAGAKLADLFVGVALIVLRRSPARG